MDLNHVRKLAGINEAKSKTKADYDDSGEFTDELMEVGGLIIKVDAIINQQRWSDWMKITDENYSTKCIDVNKRMVSKFKELKNLYEQLEGMLTDAS